MKFLNDFKNLFAILGVVSIIFWTCSSESSSDDSSSNLPPQLTGGTYQVSNVTGNNWLVALNTETGVMKTYYSSGFDWYEVGTGTLVGLDGNLVFTH